MTASLSSAQIVNLGTAQSDEGGSPETLENGASNETLMFESDFESDTIMNFTTGADPTPSCENGGLPADQCLVEE